MDATKLAQLRSKLERLQERKTVGLITYRNLDQFVLLVEGIYDKAQKTFGRPNSAVAVRATMSPRTTRREYEGRSTPVAYRGPYTTVIFDNGEYRVERDEPLTDWWAANRRFGAGMNVEIRLRPAQSLSFEKMLEFAAGADVANSDVRIADDVLLVALHFPYPAVQS